MSDLRRMAAAAFLLGLGCGFSPEQRVIPLDQAKRDMAIERSEGLRAMLNRGACGQIYSEASSQFRSRSRDDWISECEQIRAKLGKWESLKVATVGPCGVSGVYEVACVHGSAVFASARCHIEVSWLPEEGGMRLFSFALRNGKEWIFPPSGYRPQADPIRRHSGAPNPS